MGPSVMVRAMTNDLLITDNLNLTIMVHLSVQLECLQKCRYLLPSCIMHGIRDFHLSLVPMTKDVEPHNIHEI